MQSQATQQQSNPKSPSASSLTLQDRLIESLTPIIEGLGYELVHLEVQTHRAKTIRIYIDRLISEGRTPDAEAIGVEDCATVSRGLDEPLEKLVESETLLAAGYELEVSSPGVDRPLRKETDFERFREREARLHTFRPLTAEELANEDYAKRNPKQKNFLGILKGLRGGAVLLSIPASMGSVKKGAKKPSKKKAVPNEKFDLVEIPRELVSKANLEPNFDDIEEKT